MDFSRRDRNESARWGGIAGRDQKWLQDDLILGMI